MDYEVFLLARIKEAWDETGDNDLAVAIGLADGADHHVGRRSPDHRVRRLRRRRPGLIKQLGLGMAVAVIVDATVVRPCWSRR